MPETGTDIRMCIGFQNSISGLTKKSILTSLVATAIKCICNECFHVCLLLIFFMYLCTISLITIPVTNFQFMAVVASVNSVVIFVWIPCIADYGNIYCHWILCVLRAILANVGLANFCIYISGAVQQ